MADPLVDEDNTASVKYFKCENQKNEIKLAHGVIPETEKETRHSLSQKPLI